MPGLRATLHEFKRGVLRSGSKHGPLVTNPKQAVAIALSEKRPTALGRAKAKLRGR